LQNSYERLLDIKFKNKEQRWSKLDQNIQLSLEINFTWKSDLNIAKIYNVEADLIKKCLVDCIQLNSIKRSFGEVILNENG